MGFISIVEYKQIGYDHNLRIMMPMVAAKDYAHPPIPIGEEPAVSEPFRPETKYIEIKVFDERCSIDIGADPEPVAGRDVADAGERFCRQASPNERIAVVAA